MHDRSEGDINLGDARAAWQRGYIDAETQALLDEDARWFLHQALSTPCLNVVERAEGIYLIDTAGRRIMDFHGNSVHQVGYGHPRVIEAVTRQLATLPFSPRRYTNRAAIELARRLAELAPGRAEQGAVRAVRHRGDRHGAEAGAACDRAAQDAVDVGRLPRRFARCDLGRRRGDLPARRRPAAAGYRARAAAGAGAALLRRDGPRTSGWRDYIDYVLEVQGDVGAVIAEPVRWTTLEAPPADFWPRVRASCDRHGALLIFDEIPSCLGRTGTMFACEQVDCVPDMLVLGKGLGGGVFPMAALIAREDLDVAADRALGHYTHEKSSVGCAAALATLDVIRDEGLLERSRELGAYGLERLHAMHAVRPDGPWGWACRSGRRSPTQRSPRR